MPIQSQTERHQWRKRRNVRKVKAPFASLEDEAKAIEAMLKTDVSKKIGTINLSRLAKFNSDALKMATELRILTYSQGYSHGNSRT